MGLFGLGGFFGGFGNTFGRQFQAPQFRNPFNEAPGIGIFKQDTPQPIKTNTINQIAAANMGFTGDSPEMAAAVRADSSGQGLLQAFAPGAKSLIASGSPVPTPQARPSSAPTSTAPFQGGHATAPNVNTSVTANTKPVSYDADWYAGLAAPAQTAQNDIPLPQSRPGQIAPWQDQPSKMEPWPSFTPQPFKQEDITVPTSSIPNPNSILNGEQLSSNDGSLELSARSRTPDNHLSGVLQQMTDKYNLPPGYLTKTAEIESSFNPRDVSSTGAAGLFQFTRGTAQRMGLADRFDPVASADAAARLAVSNKAALSSALGRDPSAGELYLAHQQGAAGASALLAHPDMNAIDALTPAYGGNRAAARRAILVNGGNANMTAGQFASRFTNKFGGGTAVASATPL
ncbi:MAG TPA: transglycosylase SLT domain-containing protein, partial [Acidobacteriaceae bacterium]|nr:transglycosylase SLT domain-containing protein [Acidobacteriaceae bacterium]